MTKIKSLPILPILFNADPQNIIGYLNTEAIDPALLDHAELFLTKNIYDEILAIGVTLVPVKEKNV